MRISSDIIADTVLLQSEISAPKIKHLKQGRMIDPRHVKLKRFTLVTIIKVMPILHI